MRLLSYSVLLSLLNVPTAHYGGSCSCIFFSMEPGLPTLGDCVGFLYAPCPLVAPEATGPRAPGQQAHLSACLGLKAACWRLPAPLPHPFSH